jgi:hypothetical protein
MQLYCIVHLCNTIVLYGRVIVLYCAVVQYDRTVLSCYCTLLYGCEPYKQTNERILLIRIIKGVLKFLLVHVVPITVLDFPRCY